MSTRFSSDLFRSTREESGLSRMELAAQVERSVYLIIAIEAGKSLPSVPVLAKAADALGVPIDALFTSSIDDVAGVR